MSEIERAYAAANAVLAGVEQEDLSKPTPCASWDVRSLINHMAGAARFFGVTARTGKGPQDPDEDVAASDFRARFSSLADEAVAAFSAEGTLEKTMTLPFGEVPGSVVMNMAATDAFVHAWDLARATGQPSDLDPELAEQLLVAARQMLQPGMRGPDGERAFGPEQPAPPGAPAADRLAAFMGRCV
ncbi:MAG TPA: TIGR03086 family metal-binding protein [Acidimicrobiales bacterium]|nr:TIGR03086 family metal-binding protein [Acidimicrobiales bacterium]